MRPLVVVALALGLWAPRGRVLAQVGVGEAPSSAAPTDEPAAQADLAPPHAQASLPHAASAPLVELPGDPRYVLAGVVVRGNVKTDTAVILREVGLSPGDVVTASDPRVEGIRLRLLSLGYFLDVRPSLEKGPRRGEVFLILAVEERGTVILDAIHLGTSEATTFWGGLDLAERNFLGRGMVMGGGFVASSRPRVAEAQPGLAFSVRAAGPSRRDLSVGGSLLYSRGSEFFRTSGDRDAADPALFTALGIRRVGGAVSLGTDLSRTVRLYTEGRFETIHADLPTTRSRALSGGAVEPISFGVHEGDSRLSSVALLLDFDTRSDPVLPRSGHRVALGVEAALPFVGSSYSYAKGTLQYSLYHPIGHEHVLSLHVFGGGIFGDAPYFERFFVGDLNYLLPPRALGLNFSTLPSRNLLGTSIADHRYDPFAARALVEYAVPVWRRRHGFVYRGVAFAAAGLFGMARLEDLRARDTARWDALPIDVTADLGLRLDTYVGIFTLSIANALGRLPL